jgi:hypothetical protein
MICLCYKYPYQNTLEYKMNKRVGFQNNFKMRHEESLGLLIISEVFLRSRRTGAVVYD